MEEILNRIEAEKLLSLLTERERDIIYLLYWEDLRVEDIAKHIGQKYRGEHLKDSTIRYHLKKIKQKLRDHLHIAVEDE